MQVVIVMGHSSELVQLIEGAIVEAFNWECAVDKAVVGILDGRQMHDLMC